MSDQNEKKKLKVVMFIALGFAVLPWLVTITEVLFSLCIEVPFLENLFLLIERGIYFCYFGWWLVPIGLIVFALVKAPPFRSSSLRILLILQLIFTLISGYYWLGVIGFAMDPSF